ncbi:MAG: excinuclease ABC subunit UvrC [Spirochaetia bacterium]|nr:excinuclease ABC subunit UvrC [Spirochaetia bacterium]
MMNLPENLAPLYDRVASIPALPGCYLWKRIHPETQKAEVLYVGKAINLRNRIRSYFQMADYKTRYLMAKVSDLEYIVTSNELEALLLENNLIKQHSPPYNLRLKDDKRYPYLCLTTGEAFPRLIITRRKTNPKHTYFGPYSDAGAARNIMALILKIFPIRKRKQALPAKTPRRPCLNYHIGLCLAPCAEKVSQQDYGIIIEKIKNFLEAKNDQVIPDLENEMNKYAQKMDYEKAAVYRDIISDVKAIYSRQNVHEDIDDNNYDVVGLSGMNQSEVDEVLGLDGQNTDTSTTENHYYAQIVLLRIRNGNLINKGSYALAETPGADGEQSQNSEFHSEFIETFLREYYLKLTEIPPIIFINTPLNTHTEWEKFLGEKFYRDVTIVSEKSDPRLTDKKSLIEMAENNARLSLRERILSEKIRNSRFGLKQIQNFLGLPKLPEMIECYDISNIQGTSAVGCGVALKNGIPYKAGYRKYKIATKNTPDDPAMIYEVLSRRMRAFSEKTAEIPDLIVIDGGITQLNAALRARSETKVNVQIVSLAKKEETIVTENNRSIHMDKNSPGMLILRLARDEAHRFSVAYHRNVRSKKFMV